MIDLRLTKEKTACFQDNIFTNSNYSTAVLENEIFNELDKKGKRCTRLRGLQSLVINIRLKNFECLF